MRCLRAKENASFALGRPGAPPRGIRTPRQELADSVSLRDLAESVARVGRHRGGAPRGAHPSQRVPALRRKRGSIGCATRRSIALAYLAREVGIRANPAPAKQYGRRSCARAPEKWEPVFGQGHAQEEMANAGCLTAEEVGTSTRSKRGCHGALPARGRHRLRALISGRGDDDGRGHDRDDARDRVRASLRRRRLPARTALRSS